MCDAVQRFIDANRAFAVRSPDLLRFKVKRMAEEGPFAFLRGTFHLFAEDVLAGAFGPLPLFGGGAGLDLVGDAHAENFGTFKADDGVIHYDVNDFDETTTGRFDFDVCRQTVSWFLASRSRNDSLAQAVGVALGGLAAYADTVRRLLKKGRDNALDVSESHPSGCPPVDDRVRAGAAVDRRGRAPTVFLTRPANCI